MNVIRRCLFIFVLISILMSSFVAASENVGIGAVLIPAGTEVKFSLAGSLSSKLHKKGAEVLFSVTSPVKGKIGHTLIPAGSRVEGEIIRVRRSGMFSQPGRIEIGKLRVQAFDSNFYPLSGNLVIQGRGCQTTAIFVAAGLSWPVAFFPGSEAVSAGGSEFAAKISGDCWCHVVDMQPIYAESRNSVSRHAWEKTVALALKGDSESAYKVAVWAYYGIGMQANPALSLKYLELAIAGGLPENLQNPARQLLQRLSGSALLF